MGEGKRHALAASSVKDASVASDAGMVDKDQMGGQKPVSSIGSRMCQAFCDLIMMMRYANGVSQVKCKNLVERCVRRSEEKEMYEIQRNAGGLFLHGYLWGR